MLLLPHNHHSHRNWTTAIISPLGFLPPGSALSRSLMPTPSRAHTARASFLKCQKEHDSSGANLPRASHRIEN